MTACRSLRTVRSRGRAGSSCRTLLPVRNPLFDHAGDGQNAGLDRLEPMSRNIDAALDDQCEEILQAGQERDERRGIRLFGNLVKTCNHLYWSIETGIGGQDGNPAGSEPAEVQRNARQILAERPRYWASVL